MEKPFYNIYRRIYYFFDDCSPIILVFLVGAVIGFLICYNYVVHSYILDSRNFIDKTKELNIEFEKINQAYKKSIEDCSGK